jgi:4-hydroxy-tetrahydrodipicolinate synthase
MSVVPYYNKPMQAGILAHFQSIAASTGLPIVLHDIPARTAREMSDETIIRLAESPQFIDLNDAAGSVARLFRLRSRLAVRVPADVRRRRGRAALSRERRRRLHFRWDS